MEELIKKTVEKLKSGKGVASYSLNNEILNKIALDYGFDYRIVKNTNGLNIFFVKKS